MDVALDARALYDAIVAIDACEPQGSSFKLHLISVRVWLAQGTIRRVHWVGARDLLADGLAKGGIDGTLQRNVSNGFSYGLAHEALTHVKISVGSATKSSAEDQ